MRAVTSSSLVARAVAPRPVGVPAGLATAFALSVAACSSPSSTATPTSGTTASTAAPAGGGASNAAEVHALSSQIQAGAHSTFKAVYDVQTTTGKSQAITVEQKPPKSVLGTASGSVINDGTKTYFCSSSGATRSCLAMTGTNPLASLTAIFDPQTILSAVQRAATQADAHAAGYSLSFSSASYGGQSAKCVTYAGAGQTGKACVTTTGVLAYVQAGGNTVTLTSLSSSPPDSDFGLPSGATVITEPSVP